MKRATQLMVLTLTLVFFSNTIFAAEEVKEKASMTFKEFTENLMLSKNTSLYVKHFWANNARGKSFTWTGKVVTAKGGRGKAELQIANSSTPLYKGFNIILVTHQLDKAAALKVGQEIKFKGIVYNYKGSGRAAIVVYMEKVKFLNLDKKGK